MTKIICLSVLILLLYGFCSLSPCHAASAREPNYKDTNVILISIDTLRHDHLGCYGYYRNTSPNIDRLAKHSVVFENFIAQAYLTPISQMSIFTSQYPRVNGLVQFEIKEEKVTSTTLPSILKYYGYTNAAFLSSPEFYLNFRLKESGAVLATDSIFQRPFDVFIPSKTERGFPKSAFDWIVANRNKKFFVWIPLGTVHRPYGLNVSEPYKSMFDPKDYRPFFLGHEGSIAGFEYYVSSSILSRIYHNKYYINFSPVYELKKEDVQYIRGRYDSGIFMVDKFIGGLLLILEQYGLMDNTMIILHSVHGEDLGEHGYFQHYDIYDTEVKNALLIKFPRNKFKGKKIIPQIQGIDIMPTILDYLHIPINHEAQGKSIMPLIEYNRLESSSEFAYITRIPLWEFMLCRWLIGSNLNRPGLGNYTKEEGILKYKKLLQQYFGVYPQYHYPPYDIAVRTNKWKLIIRRHKELLEKISWWGFITGQKVHIDEVELYDLEKDPYEQNNVATIYPDVVTKLKEKLFEWDADNEKKQSKIIGNLTNTIIPYP